MPSSKPESWILDLPPCAGRFTRLKPSYRRFAMRGWVFHPDADLDAVDVYVGGKLAGTAKATRGAGPEALRAWRGRVALGFSFEASLPRDFTLSRVDLVSRIGGKPASRMSSLLPSKRDERVPLPPAELAERVAALHGPKFRSQGLRMYTDISDQLARLGVARSARILDWGCGCGRITSFIQARQPRAKIVGCDIDAEAIAWCRSHLAGEFEQVAPAPPTKFAAGEMDAVIATSVLTHLTEENQHRWLAEIRRILVPGGYFLASTHGDFAHRLTASRRPLWKRLLALGMPRQLSGIDDTQRDNALDGIAPRGYYRAVYQSREYTVSTCSKYFRVVDYIERGLHGFQDLVILRRDD